MLLLCGGIGAYGATAGPAPQSGKLAAAGVSASQSVVVLTPSVAPTESPSPVDLSPSAAATPAVVIRTVTETQKIPFTVKRVNDPSRAAGSTAVRTPGVNGVSTSTYQVTFTGGVQTAKKLLRRATTKAPIAEIIAVGTKKAQKCDPNYTGACVPIASDVDCAGGTGDGPAYVTGPLRVVGTDIYGLDGDDDGIGCENN